MHCWHYSRFRFWVYRYSNCWSLLKTVFIDFCSLKNTSFNWKPVRDQVRYLNSLSVVSQELRVHGIQEVWTHKSRGFSLSVLCNLLQMDFWPFHSLRMRKVHDVIFLCYSCSHIAQPLQGLVCWGTIQTCGESICQLLWTIKVWFSVLEMYVIKRNTNSAFCKPFITIYYWTDNRRVY